MGSKPRSGKILPYVIVVVMGIAIGFLFVYQYTSLSESFVFDQIYEVGFWGRTAEGEGTSGPGSTEEVTRTYRQFLENLIREERIRSVVDAGCGDWAFSQYIDWGGAEYLGIDVSKVLLERTKARFTRPGVRFEHGSAIDVLPKADLLIVKDVLQHLPNADVQEFINNNLRGDRYRIAVLTHDRWNSPAQNNGDIRRGAFRGIDLGLPPFNVQGLEEHELFASNPPKVVQVLRLDASTTGTVAQ